MNSDIQERLKQIQMENNIWIIYLVIIGFSYYANYLETNYFITKNPQSKLQYRKINAYIFITLILVYLYFEKDAWTSFQKKRKNETEKKYDTLILIATTAVLISGFIFLYIILEDEDLETEIAFS